MPRASSVLKLGSVAAAGVLGAVGLRRLLLRLPVPPHDETRTVDGLSHEVRVRIDRWGVPHVDARTATDALFTQGYLHARDRLWQMELNRRIARGELAELFGEVALPADRFLRRLGFRRDAERDLAGLDPDARSLLSAYTAGANAYLSGHRAPIEYLLLRAKPRPWDPVDTIAFGRYMSWTQTTNWESELIRARLIARLGPARAAALEPGNPAAGVPEHGAIPAPDLAAAAQSFLPLAALVGGASNNWVVAPGRSTTGHALLANDPHLFPRIPAVWYMVHLRGGEYDVVGATLPGIAGVIIGHTPRIAWGVTAGMADCEDLVIEQSGDGTVVPESIRIRGRADPVVEEVTVTRHGPVLNGTLDIPAGGAPLVLRSVLHDFPAPIAATLELNRATDWPSFRAALEGWHFPSLNFVYADVDGNIGYQLAGRVPIRQQPNGSVPVPGWTNEHEWIGYVPFDEMPQAFNPPEGIFATANSRPDAPTTHFLGRDWADDSRWRRIMQLLRSRDRHALEDLEQMQADVVSLPARVITEQLTGLHADAEPARAALDALRQWDGAMRSDSVAAAVYAVFRREFTRLHNPDMPRPLLAYLLGRGIDEVMMATSGFFFRGSSILVEQVKAADASILQEAFDAAVEWLRSERGDDLRRWTWGSLHAVTFRHPIGAASPAIDRLLRLSRGPLPLGGDADTVAQAGVDPWHPLGATAFGVSYRQVLNTGDWDRGRFILPTGQSGHPGSPHYDDMLAAWHRVEYRPMLYTDAAVEAATTERIRLQPAIPSQSQGLRTPDVTSV